MILVVKYVKSSEQVFEFKELYLYKLDLIQKSYTKPSFYFLIILIDNLSPY